MPKKGGVLSMRNFVLVICLILTGCLANRIDLVANKTISVTTHKPDGYSMNASVYEQEGALRLFGRVTKSPFSSSNVHGHVDVEVTDPDGNRVYCMPAVLHSLPAARHVSKPASFTATIPIVPPLGSKVSFTYNPLVHSDSADF
jgi:hypothetical protein